MMDCPQTEIIDQPGLFDRLKTSGKRIPLSGSLEVTFRCNLRCTHCYLGDSRIGIGETKELTTQEVFGIIDQIVDAGTLWFLITGGEPFLRRDIFEIYSYAVHKGLLINLFTNGTLLTPELSNKLADLPPRMMEITLYGRTQQTYEQITGVAGSHARCMQGIDLLLERGIPLKLKTMAMRLNVHEIGEMKSFATSLGVDFRFDPLLVGSLDGQQTPFPLRLTAEEIIQLDQTIPDINNEFTRLVKRRGTKKTDPSYLYQCGAGLSTYHIDPYGKLTACILSRTQSYDLRSGSFPEGWEDYLYKVRFQPAIGKIKCDDCNLINICGHCPGRANLENGSRNEPSEYFCKVSHLRASALINQDIL